MVRSSTLRKTTKDTWRNLHFLWLFSFVISLKFSLEGKKSERPNIYFSLSLKFSLSEDGGRREREEKWSFCLNLYVKVLLIHEYSLSMYYVYNKLHEWEMIELLDQFPIYGRYANVHQQIDHLKFPTRVSCEILWPHLLQFGDFSQAIYSMGFGFRVSDP